MACRRLSAADRCRPWPCRAAPNASRWRHQPRIEHRWRHSHPLRPRTPEPLDLSAPSDALLPCTHEITSRSARQELFQLRRAQGLGVESVDGRNVIILPKDTTIPTKKSKTFTSSAGNRGAVEINLLQGDRP